MRTVISGGVVFDGTGAAPAAADVVVDDETGRIVDVGAGLDGDRAVDVGGRGVLPGLIDAHVHVVVSHFDLVRSLEMPFSLQFYEAAANLATTLALGITTVRDAGGADLGVKAAVERGMIPGPRMQVSLSMLSQTGGHGDDWMVCGSRIPWLLAAHPGRPPAVVDGPDEMRRRVRQLVAMGADVIKVATSGGVLSPGTDPRRAQFRPLELDVLVEEATAAGRFVMAHATAVDGVKNAVRAGIRSVEHGIFLDDEAISLMLDRGTWLVPTLLAPQGVLDAAAGGASIPEEMVRKAGDVVAEHRASFARAVSAGVKIAMGTDCPVSPHGTHLGELALMVEGGLSGGEALVAATSSAASLLGVGDSLGRLAPGFVADVVVVDGAPDDVAGLADRVYSVWKDGTEVVSRSAPAD
jgi:imidazolonepropionase-like amidohydrolase